MPGKNRDYRGPDIMIKLMRATSHPWQQKSMRNGYLISNAQHRERYKSDNLFAPLEPTLRLDICLNEISETCTA